MCRIQTIGSVRQVLVINWKSVYIILYCCVQYVKIYTEQRACVDSINFFCFHLKRSATESYFLLHEANGDHAPLQETCNGWFRVPKVAILMLQTRNMENCQKILGADKTWGDS